MKFLTRILPNISISLMLALAVLVVLDWYNPMLGLLTGTYFHILFFLCAVSALSTAGVLYGLSRKKRKEEAGADTNTYRL